MVDAPVELQPYLRAVSRLGFGVEVVKPIPLVSEFDEVTGQRYPDFFRRTYAWSNGANLKKGSRSFPFFFYATLEQQMVVIQEHRYISEQVDRMVSLSSAGSSIEASFSAEKIFPMIWPFEEYTACLGPTAASATLFNFDPIDGTFLKFYFKDFSQNLISFLEGVRPPESFEGRALADPNFHDYCLNLEKHIDAALFGIG